MDGWLDLPKAVGLGERVTACLVSTFCVVSWVVAKKEEVLWFTARVRIKSTMKMMVRYALTVRSMLAAV